MDELAKLQGEVAHKIATELAELREEVADKIAGVRADIAAAGDETFYLDGKLYELLWLAERLDARLMPRAA